MGDGNNNEVKDLTIGGVMKESGKVTKKIGVKVAEKVGTIAENLKDKQKIKGKKDYNEIKDEVSVDTSANNWYMIFAPIIGFIMQPAILLLVLDINEDQLKIIRATLIASGIGLILTVFLVMIAFKDGINKTVLSVYRHFTTKKQLSDLEVDHMSEELIRVKEENETLKTKVESLNSDLFEYNIDKEIKKRSGTN